LFSQSIYVNTHQSDEVDRCYMSRQLTVISQKQEQGRIGTFLEY